jgi:hypothetical protein
MIEVLDWQYREPISGLLPGNLAELLTASKSVLLLYFGT